MRPLYTVYCLVQFNPDDYSFTTVSPANLVFGYALDVSKNRRPYLEAVDFSRLNLVHIMLQPYEPHIYDFNQKTETRRQAQHYAEIG